MSILALDLGTKTGWALLDGGRVVSGVQDFTPRRGDSPGMRYVEFNRWLRQLAVGATMIVFELPHLRGGAAATILAGLQTRLEEYCATMEINHRAVHSATLKKWVTGSGRADKRAMRDAVVERWQWVDSGSDDEADAIGLLHYAIEEIAGKEASCSGV